MDGKIFRIFCLLCVSLTAQAKAPNYQGEILEPFTLRDFAEVRTGASPDNSHSLFLELIQKSKKEIRVSAYMLRSVSLGRALAESAKRGVRVKILLDGWTVGRSRAEKLDDLELAVANEITQAGGEVFFLRSDRGPRDDRRFRYIHTKYAVVDDSLFLSSENFANNGFSPNGTVGSRGWVISVKNAALAAEYAKVFDGDCAPVAGYSDIAPFGSEPAYSVRNPSYVPDHNAGTGNYLPKPGSSVTGSMVLERVLSPDDSLAPTRSILGAIRSATKSMEIESLSFASHFGSQKDTTESNPNPIAEEVLAAARKGVKVRVLLNPPFFLGSKPPEEGNGGDETTNRLSEWVDPNIFQMPAQKQTAEDTRSNQALISYFREKASQENLNIQANFFFVKGDSLRILHNKGLVVDGEKVLVSSINWTENSLKNNREAGVIVTHPKVAAFYQGLFESDWLNNRAKK